MECARSDSNQISFDPRAARAGSWGGAPGQGICHVCLQIGTARAALNRKLRLHGALRE
jgi:hypothetical protein